MKACVRGDPVSLNDRTLYDLQHFYVDEEGFGQFTCGIAFETMMSMLRTRDDAPFRDESWYNAVSRSSNRIVRGFLAEQICLSHIATHGLMTVNPNLKQMSTATFQSNPDFSEFLSTDLTTRLYIPIPYNFKAVDGVILSLDRKSKRATMFPIQFTLSKDHKESDKDFHTLLWPRWREKIVSAGFEVYLTFVWIDQKQPSIRFEPEQVKTLRSGNMVCDEYSVIHVGVEDVDLNLASALRFKQ
jgi:hypothetical protein